MNKFFKIAAFCLAAVTSFTACQKAEDIFQRDTDRVSVDCIEQNVVKYIKVTGAWSSDCSEVSDWISLEPAEGTGDGQSFIPYTIQVKYNKGEAREGIFYLIHDGSRFPVIVSQGACDFKIGPEVRFEGDLVVGIESKACVLVRYSGASGEESVDVSGTVTGAGAAGLSIKSTKFEEFISGSNYIVIPIVGTPTTPGDIECTVSVDGKEMGKVKGTVTKPIGPGPEPTTKVLAKWSFAGPASSDLVEEMKTRYPNWISQYTMEAFEGQGTFKVVEAAGKTATAINNASFTGGHAYLKGMYVDDAFVLELPVSSIQAGSEIQFTGCMGGSGSSAGYFLCEYSTDGSTWTAAPGAVTETIYEKSVTYHAHPEDNTTGIDVGTFDVKFKTPDVSGKLYIRLRVCADVRLTANNTITTGGGGSTRFKGDLVVTLTTSGGTVTGDPEGFPVGWNFYAAGCSSKDACAATDAGKDWLEDPHIVHPTSGQNTAATLTGVGANITSWGFNPSIQIQGFVKDDYWLATIPVKNIAKGTKVSVEVGCGGAGSAAGVWLLQYSADGSSWTTADGAQTIQRGDASVEAHLWTTPGSISQSGYEDTRKSYNKETDDTYHKYEVELDCEIADGKLYFRLLTLNYRGTPSASSAPAAGKWCDLKGFEFDIVK